MKRYFIDSNIFLRFLSKENETTYTECANFLKSVKSNKVSAASSHFVLTEVIWTLQRSYKFSKKEVIPAAKSILNMRGIYWTNKVDPLASLDLYQDKGIKFIDSFLASIPQIQSKQWTIVSYDKDFDKLNLPRLEPDQVKS